ncbi:MULTISPECIES: aldo/keto reductase [unclassified Planococcus (in: firmicutes)]|uniref:aldo/keto reductase n=1 Tax=unclassified Planococcus (in: firmicutes) TaxID=2662419 RepID=UPI000C339B35|nr:MULTISPECIES: aldo/keto reductase [unclassified Planococcus (in: firmicutes)]AUD13401.1 aldo/keto reductase [Planococcus sp. MB-3u-03]PKG46194.1 aldo/keto reductase [Planococcus sp. Urea-trap-24]PKG89817.1 aldo/keto reductase [Planococcus sp. Urea-3u-39]PKH43903.1 aldo/keto reductase [Planococcus sp. MB-3u-09]
MNLTIESTKTLHNGVEMPRFGLGVYKMTDKGAAVEAMVKAIQTGYKAIDTATVYDNEAEVGEAIRAGDVPREKLFITSKVWNTDQGYDQTLRAFEASLKRLDMDYLDLYLTHWAIPDTFEETYRAIERLYDEKLIRAAGVSNHQQHHLEKILGKANTKPMVNQIELHPQLTQESLREFCAVQDIAVTSWSPLARGRLLEDPVLSEIGEKYGKSIAQTIIRWHLQNDLIVIPKSVTPSRIVENADVFDFELSEEEMKQISALNQDWRSGTHPDEIKV